MQERIFEHYDVCIVGASIAGNYLAYLLSKSNLRIVVLEDHKEIGSPFQCAGIISQKWYIILLIIGVYIFIFELYRKKENPFTNISYTFFAVIYIALPFSLLNKFVFPVTGVDIYEFKVLISYFILIWIYDSSAYVFGVSFGKHRLFERISPKKSWEGLIGGSIITLVSGWVLTLIFSEFHLIDWMIIPVLMRSF